MNKVLQVVGKVGLTVCLCILLGMIFNGVLWILLPDPNEWPEVLTRLINGPKSLFVVLGAVIIMLLVVERRRTWSLGLKVSSKASRTAIGIFYGILLVLLTFLALYLIGEVKINTYSLESGVLIVFMVSAFLAICDTTSEEIMFRGYLQGMIKSSYGYGASVLASSVPFALLHSLGHDIFSNPLTVVNLFLAGIFLALLREVTGSLWMPMGFHFAWNLFNDVFGPANSLIVLEWGQNEWISGGPDGFSKGFANTLIMLTVILVLAYRFQKEQIPRTEGRRA